MKFLDLNGLRRFLSKILNHLEPRTNFFSNYIDDDDNEIPDAVDVSYLNCVYQSTMYDIVDIEMNIFNWYRDSPTGAILDIIVLVDNGSLTCKGPVVSFLEKLKIPDHNVVTVSNIALSFGDYIRVINKGSLGVYSYKFKGDFKL